MIGKKPPVDAERATNGPTGAVENEEEKEGGGKEENEEEKAEVGKEEKEVEKVEDGEGKREEASGQQPEEAAEVFQLPQRLAAAYEHLEEAFKRLQTGEYEDSWNLVATATSLFNSVGICLL